MTVSDSAGNAGQVASTYSQIAAPHCRVCQTGYLRLGSAVKHGIAVRSCGWIFVGLGGMALSVLAVGVPLQASSGRGMTIGGPNGLEMASAILPLLVVALACMVTGLILTEAKPALICDNCSAKIDAA